MKKSNVNRSAIEKSAVDRDQLRYGIEIMRVAMGKARWLSKTYANGRSAHAYRHIDKELCDLIELMDEHQWDIKALFKTAAKPNTDLERAELNQRVTLKADWEDAVEKAYKTLLPRTRSYQEKQKL